MFLLLRRIHLPRLCFWCAVRTNRMQQAFPGIRFIAFIYTLLDFTAKCKDACSISAIFRYFLQVFSFPVV